MPAALSIEKRQFPTPVRGRQPSNIVDELPLVILAAWKLTRDFTPRPRDTSDYATLKWLQLLRGRTKGTAGDGKNERKVYQMNNSAL